MRMDWKIIKQWFLLIAFGIFLYWGLNHLDVITGGVGRLLGMVTPFLFGLPVITTIFIRMSLRINKRLLFYYNR